MEKTEHITWAVNQCFNQWGGSLLSAAFTHINYVHGVFFLSLFRISADWAMHHSQEATVNDVPFCIDIINLSSSVHITLV